MHENNWTLLVSVAVLLLLFTVAKAEESDNSAAGIISNRLLDEENSTARSDGVNDEKAEFGSAEFYFFLFSSIGITLIAGLMSGLTVGYLSLDELILELKIKNGTEEERKQSKEIFEILEQHHLLLVSLLVTNAAAMETLPIFLEKLVSEVAAVIISVTAVLIFGEIIPQAVCTGPNQIKIASAAAPFTKTLMMMEGFVAYPIAKLLDCILGEHTHNRYKNSDLKALITLHTEAAVQEREKMHQEGENVPHDNIGLSIEQIKLIHGAMDLNAYTAIDAMKKYESVEKIGADQKITPEFLKQLAAKGYSRYPVFNGSIHNVIGIVMVKRLLGHKDSRRTIGSLSLRAPLIVPPNMPLTDLLTEFQKGKSHIALVTKQTNELKKNMGLDLSVSGVQIGYEEAMDTDPVKILGIVTLEDVVEKALGENILDENDYDKEHKPNVPPPAKPRDISDALNPSTSPIQDPHRAKPAEKTVDKIELINLAMPAVSKPLAEKPKPQIQDVISKGGEKL